MGRKTYELFLEKSGLTIDEANDFLEMKIKQVLPPTKKEKVNMKFINDLSKEAQKWKRTQNDLD
jgi:hypothetical protein